MRIKKVINNNILCVVDDRGSEMIVTGKGLGFKRKTGEHVDPALVEKTYHMEGKAEQRKLRELVAQIPIEHLRLTQDLIEYVRSQISAPLNESLLITLADHISFAIKRKQDGVEFNNPLEGAIMSCYPTEYHLGQHCLKVIQEELQTSLSPSEAAFIAMHIVNAELNTSMSVMYDMTRLIEGTLEVVEYYYQKKFDQESLDFNRFIVHLRYFAQRLFQAAPGCTDEYDEEFREMIRRSCKQHYKCAQGNAKTHWIWIPIVGVVYFVVYYFTFYFMITKMDLKTPGREDEGEETKLFTRSDFKAKTGVGPDGSAPAGGVSDPVSALILKGLGGKANLSDVDCCATRLRVTVIDPEKVSDAMLKQSGASGVIRKGNGIQVIYGPQVAVIKSNLEDFMDSPESDRLDQLDTAAPAPAPAAKPAAEKKSDAVLAAHMNGAVVPMAEVQDEAFAACVLGDGVAIEPSEGKLYAPADAVVDNLFDTKHAIGLITTEGVELLLHIGINTVQMGGKHFETHVKVGQKVKKGDLLISFDREAIQKAGYLCTTPMIVYDTDDYASVKALVSGQVKAGTPLLEVKG